MAVSQDDYVLGRSDRETRRLTLQHQIVGPLTRRVFEAAGIGAGMKVLDLGSGAGDVALLRNGIHMLPLMIGAWARTP